MARQHSPRARPSGPGHLALWVVALACLAGCPARIARGRDIVHELNLHGVRQVDEGELRRKIATRETSYFPTSRPRWLRWWRWWWVEPEYFDAGSFLRDRLRIRRYYQARGYYSAEVLPPRTTTLDTNRLRIDVTVREGQPTRVADIRLRGCEPGDRVLPEAACRAIRERFELHPGDVFDEDLFAHDRQQVRDFTLDAGYTIPVLASSAAVDPTLRRAWIEYTVRPGPLGRFGRVRLFVLPNEQPLEGRDLPHGIPAATVRSSLGIAEGERYSRRVLADAQRALFDLGVFGIARIEERPRSDGVVDLDVRLSTVRFHRLRFGVGFEADPSRNNVHLSLGWEHRNFLGGLRYLRLEVRPVLFFPPIFTTPGVQVDVPSTLQLGVSALAELRQPELLHRTTGILATNFDYGPDPVNPALSLRESFRVSLGLERAFDRAFRGAVFARFTQVSFLLDPRTSEDPIFRQQYENQIYVYFEQSLVWDRRDDRVRPRRGAYLSASLTESLRSPISEYTFVRALGEARGYLPFGGHVVLAFRGAAGAIAGPSLTSSETGGARWPVPQELRFYSGGALSNRGYPFHRVGPLSTVPVAAGAGTFVDDPSRYVAIGGVALWEASVELRLSAGAFGLNLFFDASNVAGLDATPFVAPSGPVNARCDTVSPTNMITSRDTMGTGRCPPPAPPPRSLGDAVGELFREAHPTVGVGLRYLTPVGPVRLDVGLRLTDTNCQLAAQQVSVQNANAVNNHPWYYVLTAPRCDFFSFDRVPAVFHFAIGEAY